MVYAVPDSAVSTTGGAEFLRINFYETPKRTLLKLGDLKGKCQKLMCLPHDYFLHSLNFIMKCHIKSIRHVIVISRFIYISIFKTSELLSHSNIMYNSYISDPIPFNNQSYF